MSSSPPLLIVPGLGDSAEGHWQDIWLRTLPQARKVEQADWDRPQLGDWLGNIERAVAAHPGAILVAHSLGCAAVAHFGASPLAGQVRAALLAAPADLDLHSPVRAQLASFAPLPRAPLPFPTIVAASATDPYVALRRARSFARDWGATLEELGDAGHVNVASGHGRWPLGLHLLARLEEMTRSQAVAA